MPPKRITSQQITGERGITLIAQRVLAMGFLWYPTGSVEAGIDGIIEIRDDATGDVTNCIIQVQSKATKGSFAGERPGSFDYLCDERDLDYWLQGNAAVILVVSRPDTDEAYWISIKDYFQDAVTRKARKVHFDKQTHRFDVGCKDALVRLAVPEDAGVYLAPPPKRETLYSNLLPVATYAPRIYIADTDYRQPPDVWKRMELLGPRVGPEWLLSSTRIMSFHDLREFPWKHICDVGTVEDFDAQEWADSDDIDRRREFVRLLNRCVRELCGPLIRFNPRRECYYFKATKDLSPRTHSYRAMNAKTSRDVFRGYPTLDNPHYYRHSAFKGRFRRLDDRWYLEITPTYLFTYNGRDEYKFYQEQLKGIKRIEHNEAVLGQVVMWAELLRQGGDLFKPAYPFLRLDPLLTFTCDSGINDKDWLSQDDTAGDEASEEDTGQLELFS